MLGTSAEGISIGEQRRLVDWGDFESHGPSTAKQILMAIACFLLYPSVGLIVHCAGEVVQLGWPHLMLGSPCISRSRGTEDTGLK